MMEQLYPADAPAAPDQGSLSPTVGLCAAIQAGEAVKLLCGRPSPLAGRLLLRAMELSCGRTEWADVELPAPQMVLRRSCGGLDRFPPEELRALIMERFKAQLLTEA